MCGIFGYIGKKKINTSQVNQLYKLMHNRGPDFQDHFYRNSKFNDHIYLFSSRLSILDLSNRSNQPFFFKNYVIVFNGEIYNYKELAEKLKTRGIKLQTNSDTEVLLIYFSIYKENCINYFEGMWSFVIYDIKNENFFIARDRFGEKPLYFYRDNHRFYFSSELSYITHINDKKFDINFDRIYALLSHGYKTLHKNNETYLKKISYFPGGHYYYGKISQFNYSKLKRYWSPNIFKENSKTLSNQISKVKTNVIRAIDLASRSDCDISLSLSGGLDSNVIASVLKKELNKNFKAYSIIDNDFRYNELENIMHSLKKLKVEYELIKIKRENSFDKLKELINYKNAPFSTPTIYLNSLLIQKVSEDQIKVLLEGTAADEIFGGYIEHFLLHLNSIKDNKKLFNENLNYFKKYHLNYIRNPLLKNYDQYIESYHEKNIIYNNLNSEYLLNLKNVDLKKYEKNSFFSKDIFKNKMYNEVFFETVPLILDQNDSVAGFHSVENRSPFLNSKVVNLGFDLSTKSMIKNGYNKYILRKAFEGILPKKIYNSFQKKGFNGNIKSIFNIRSKKLRSEILNKKLRIYEIVKFNYIELLMNKKFLTNNESKFLFSTININFFLENNL